MRIKKKRRDLEGIPTASMSDISFCLLVFFLSTTKFDIKKGLGLVLPPPSTGENVQNVKIEDKNLARILVDKEGRIRINEEDVNVAEIEKKVRKMVSENPLLVVALKVDRKSNYANMVTVLDKLRAAGAEKISLSTN